MRDVAILLALIAVIPMILKRPWIGYIAWVVVSVMNPHRLAYGFSYSLPVALLIVLATTLGMLSPKVEKKLPMDSVVVTLIIFVTWMNITFAFSLYPESAYEQWVKVMKIMFMIFIGMALMRTRTHLDAVVWAIVVSLGFYGFKGGLFAVATGGSFKVYGPPESEVADNNAISFALVMILPLMYYLATTVAGKWARWIKLALYSTMVFSLFAILASHSRGAFLALATMTVFLWLKSDRRVIMGIVLVVVVPLAIGFMPEEWFSRMNTIKTYEEDASSMGRINTWWMAFNLANDRPITGGGFQIYTAETFARWAPDPLDVHAAHSIYFAALGEHGYVGLGLFLALCIISWFTCSSVAKKARKVPELAWAGNLGRMLQVSIIGYGVGGAFLSVLYFDVFYYLISVVVVLRVLVERGIKEHEAAQRAAVGVPR